MNEYLLSNYVLGTLSSLTSAFIVALIVYSFRTRIKRIFTATNLKSKDKSPNVELEVDAVKDVYNRWKTVFIIENTGSIEVSNLRIYLCTHTYINEELVIKPIKIESQKKWINHDGQRLQIETFSLHEGCNLTSDQRYFIEFKDSLDGTTYRLSKGSPSAKDGNIAFYGTRICRKRLPRRGLNIKGSVKINDNVAKYDIDLTVG